MQRGALLARGNPEERLGTGRWGSTRLLRSREDRRRHGHLVALQNICTPKTLPGPSEDICIWLGACLGAQEGQTCTSEWLFLSEPQGLPGARHSQAAAGDGASASLPALHWDRDTRPGLSPHPGTGSQDRALDGPSSALPRAQGTPMPSLSNYKVGKKRVCSGSNHSLAELQTPTPGLCRSAGPGRRHWHRHFSSAGAGASSASQEHPHRLLHALLQLHHLRSLQDIPSPSSDTQRERDHHTTTQTAKLVKLLLSQKPAPRQQDCSTHPFSYRCRLLHQAKKPHARDGPACQKGPAGPPTHRLPRSSRRSHRPREPRHLLPLTTSCSGGRLSPLSSPPLAETHTNMCTQGIMKIIRNRALPSHVLSHGRRRKTAPQCLHCLTHCKHTGMHYSQPLRTRTHEEQNNAEFQLRCSKLPKRLALAAAPTLPGDQDVPCGDTPPRQ